MMNLTIVFPPLLLLLNCFFISIYREWLGAYGTYVSSIITCILTIVLLFTEIDSFYNTSSYSFVDFGRYFYAVDLVDSHFVFCIDSLALFASALVILLTAFALTFGLEYMYREAFVTRLIYLLNLFATSVVFLFFSYDYFFILISWESMGLFSYLLVNFYSQRVYTMKAAIKTFVFARISDLFMFGAFILTLLVFHTTDLTTVFIQMPFKVSYYILVLGWQFQLLSVLAFSLATAGAIKGAQFFSHVWLPDAMEAPTPASALIHSSTLVIAGVFLIIRFSAIFEFTTTVNCFLIILGSLTLAFGSLVASAQYDIKKLVAYSTISQVGYLICGCGFCCYEEVFIYLVLHAINKAFLFILVGYIVHFFLGNTDMRHMGGVYSYMFDITIFLFMTSFNLTGLPYSAGYVSKEFLVFHMIRDDILALFARASILVSLFFTPVYMHILVFVVMFGPKRGFIGAYSSHWRKSTLNENIVEYGYSSRIRSQKWDTVRYEVTQALGSFRIHHVFTKCSVYLFLNDITYEQRNPRFYSWNYTSYFRRTKEFNKFVVDNRLYVATHIETQSRQQTTLVTSRLMSYILLGYYIFFSYFGEIFLLTSVGSSTASDFIQSPNFFSIKSHIFMTRLSFSNFTLSQFTLVVQSLSLFALTWLLLFNTHNSFIHLKLHFLGLIPMLWLFVNYGVTIFL